VTIQRYAHLWGVDLNSLKLRKETPMSFLKTLNPEDHPETLGNSNTMVGKVAKLPVFESMNLRPDLLEPLLGFINRLMTEDHELTLTTKELIASHVSEINTCAYWIDAHSAKVMAEGYTQEQVESILADVSNSTLIDDQTRALLILAEKITKHSYRVVEDDIQALRDLGLKDEAILEAIHVASFFNYFNRMVDAIGAPVGNKRAMVAAEQENNWLGGMWFANSNLLVPTVMVSGTLFKNSHSLGKWLIWLLTRIYRLIVINNMWGKNGIITNWWE
jgi:uncharacterized peroxidase-related enzyme